MKWYKQTWVWLAIIAALLMLIVLCLMDIAEINILGFLHNPNFWTAFGSWGTLAGVGVAAYSISNSNKREKQHITLQEFIKFKHEMKYIEDQTHEFTKADADKLVKEHKRNDNNNKLWNKINKYLVRVEQLSTGVNMGVFDLEMIDRMGGYFMGKQYEALKPIIEDKRKRSNNNNIYKEFEDMTKAIKNLRVKKKEPLWDGADKK